MAKSKITEGKLADLTFDAKNMNKGKAYGMHLLNKSVTNYGLGRSILVDKNGQIIAGNKTAETAGALGLENTIVVEVTGTQLVVVKRTDIDLDSDEGRGLAFADNRVSEVNLDWDVEAVKNTIGEDAALEWGFSFGDRPDYSEKNKEIDIDDLDKSMRIVLNYSEQEYEKVKDALKKYGQTPEAAVFNLLKL